MKFGAYDILGPNWLEESAVQLFCKEISGFCDKLIHGLFGGNNQIDDMDRFGVALKDYPAGGSYQNIIYYLQSTLYAEAWYRYDFGAIGNMDKYG